MKRSAVDRQEFGIILGLLLGALIAWSRVRLGVHSLSEVAAGWLLGATVGVSGETVSRDGFIFTDLLPEAQDNLFEAVG